MTEELTEEQLAERKARVAASNHRFGRVLSIIGFVLAAVAFILLVGGGLALTWCDAAANSGADIDTVNSVRGLAAASMTAVPGIVLLLSMCALIPGEQLRRGWIGASKKPQTTVLPSASMVSRFTILSVGWRSLWIVVGLVVSAVLIGIPVAGWFSGGWPSELSSENDFSAYWMIYGALSLGITVAAIVSLVKMLGYLRAVRVRGETVSQGGAGKKFWRLFDYRWRADLWLAGIGGFLVGLSPTFLSDSVGRSATADEVAQVMPGFLVVCAIGVILIAAGVVTALNYWRAGEPLGTGESFA